MLGRKTYEAEEPAKARAALRARLNGWDDLVKAASDPAAQEALDTLEPLFFNSLVLVLDRYFVHRVRMVAGKDNNPLNEVKLITESLMNNDGVFRTGNVVAYDAGSSVTGLAAGERIALGRDTFARLSDAFFEALEERFLA